MRENVNWQKPDTKGAKLQCGKWNKYHYVKQRIE